MIEVTCGCAEPRRLPESAVGKRFRCPGCLQTIQITAGEALADGAGTCDFDAALTVASGPVSVGERFLLGGVADIQIGKLPDRHIVLQGQLISRDCLLSRIDFGPSRWKLIDNHSTNGISVNGARVSEHELQEGDIVSIGEYQFEYGSALPLEIPEPELAAAATTGNRVSSTHLAARSSGTANPPPALPSVGRPCPSCERPLPASAKICVECGIHVDTGRPMLTSQDVDEDSLHESAYQWIRWVSLLVWVTPMPIPIRSEAFGTRKPYAIWTIALVTVLASIAFFFAQNFGNSGTDLMLWPPGLQHSRSFSIDPQRIHAIARKMTPEDREELRQQFDDPQHRLSDEDLVRRDLDGMIADEIGPAGEFHAYQLITHAFLHDTSGVYNFAMHLAGNMLFLLVFGTRVNALIGNLATAILYPVLAIGAASIYLLAMGNGPSGPMLGASGAIMGLAGMYLILFPAHRVFCAMWISIWVYFRRFFGCKIFQMRGFWVLLIYFGYDILMNAITSHLGSGGGGVAHWAHIGGFLTGAVLGLGVLFSRMFNTHGGDVLSVTLGKHSWPLIGKPSRWHKVETPLPRATSLTFG